MRDIFKDSNLMENMVKDIQYLLDCDEEDSIEIETIKLWDDRGILVKHGVSYK